MMQNFANTRALDEIYRPSLAENVTKWCKTLQVQEHLSNLPTITCWKCYKIMQTLQIKEDFIKFADHHLLGMLQNNAKLCKYESTWSNLHINGWQLAKMKKSIPDMSLPWNL